MTAKSSLTVRAFKIEDMEKILEIEEQAFPKTPYSEEILLDYGNRPSNKFVVLEVGQDILGYIMFSEGGHIISTAVKPAQRRKGFGRMLFIHALRHTEKRLWLEVRSRNKSAIGFYKNMGMNKIGKTRNYYGDDDALIMVLGEKTEER